LAARHGFQLVGYALQYFKVRMDVLDLVGG
jgi:hypothetical protein